MASNLPVRKTDPGAILPSRAHPDDAGLDLYTLQDVNLGPRQGGLFRTGIAIALEAGQVGLIADRSSLAKRGLKTAGGVIDAGYRGEIQVVLWNLSDAEQRLGRGERIAQLLIVGVETPGVREVEELPTSVRGEKGFGSSGK